MSELNHLIGKAKQDIDAEEQRSRKPSPRRYLNAKPFVLTLAVIALAIWFNHFFNRHLGPQTIKADLTAAAFEAGASVLSYYKLEKVLPPVIPEPAFRSLFLYEVIDSQASPPHFTLRGEINGVPVVWKHPNQETGDE